MGQGFGLNNNGNLFQNKTTTSSSTTTATNIFKNTGNKEGSSLFKSTSNPTNANIFENQSLFQMDKNDKSSNADSKGGNKSNDEMWQMRG